MLPQFLTDALVPKYQTVPLAFCLKGSTQELDAVEFFSGVHTVASGFRLVGLVGGPGI